MEIELRKHQNNLIIVGTGVILMGFWSVAKSIMMFTIDKGEWQKLIDDILKEEQVSDAAFNITASGIMGMAATITLLVTLIGLFVRVYIGKCAIAEGSGRKRGNLYVVLAVLLAIMNGVLLGLNVLSIFKTEEASLHTAMNIANDIVTIIVDLTCLITTLVMIHSVIKLRKIMKKLTAQRSTG